MPELIAIDWGTSSFRAWLLGVGGAVLDEIPSGPGILSVPGGDFDAAFEAAIGQWQSRHPELPVIASGMITSRNGWVETPYLPLPLDAQSLADALTVHVTGQGRRVHFVTGAVRNPGHGLPDVMRGEETEIIGHLAASGADEGLFVLPGTHSKWARVEGGRLTGFDTCMTGEVFAILRDHSILGRLINDGPSSPDAFLRGLQAGRDKGALLTRVFSARSLALMDRLDGGEIADYLSGLLIGDEVAAALASARGSVTVIGRGDLAERYRVALSHAGAKAALAAPGMARAGLWKIAKLAGVIT
ncbi:2-dehydro-3-deoxygalactonokinase [Paracoccus alkanivorans]|uniref:2-dehydro-3-deoxygalactonokinase n=1 Tax=Paracoccus alkanivorans TaxID=2116655 RepID=A0A3M0MII3_9RHOB|nr:2-dehydro-3-deoxygalactonokinase [Paracoccus alkanivorans]RMC37562.1 2-dehydro-3-deoxygalactonokinase [Paracoccus alkanivorans]